MSTMAQECMTVVTLDNKNKMIDRHLVGMGLIDQCPVHPREVFRPAISDGAKSIVLCHNHPSGDPTPSMDDIRVTRQLIEAGKILGISVLDHVVIGRGNNPFKSMRETGLCDFSGTSN